ncbi:MAG: hypothetical protein DRJ31_09775 [Candidatus Methanomethylicota archaeon]|uniref:Antitoxin SocA-like Panacea domain-containing protein n=2 Tax=Thermoproteota archaeon TaxID=2056631 RepID=A0A497EJU9_9CREN|nr:MAG: hypothetical protein DRJ31_09775 [Candidatus Verstraetearchaeota archaeon]
MGCLPFYEKLELSRKARSLASVLKAVGIRLSVESFEDRLRAQKVVYMLQLHKEFRRYLDFDFSMFLYGPYSPELAHVYYHMLKEVRELAEVSFSTSALAYARDVDAMSTEKLEVLATLAEAMKVNRGACEEEIVKVVHELKPRYSLEKLHRYLLSLKSLAKKYDLAL